MVLNVLFVSFFLLIRLCDATINNESAELTTDDFSNIKPHNQRHKDKPLNDAVEHELPNNSEKNQNEAVEQELTNDQDTNQNETVERELTNDQDTNQNEAIEPELTNDQDTNQKLEDETKNEANEQELLNDNDENQKLTDKTLIDPGMQELLNGPDGSQSIKDEAIIEPVEQELPSDPDEFSDDEFLIIPETVNMIEEELRQEYLEHMENELDQDASSKIDKDGYQISPSILTLSVLVGLSTLFVIIFFVIRHTIYLRRTNNYSLIDKELDMALSEKEPLYQIEG